MTVALISLYDHWSAGNRSLHAVLNRDGIESYLVFFQTFGNIHNKPPPETFDSLMELLREMKPELVGISTRSQFWWMAKRIAGRVKREIGAPVIIGGVHATLTPDEAIEVADVICRGEGESALPELVKRMRAGKPYQDIPGLWVKMPDGSITRNEPTIAVKDLDTLPLPVTDKSYLVGMEGPATRCDPLFDKIDSDVYMIAASRGCPFRCSFCCESAYKDLFGKEASHIRRRSIENLFEEFRMVKERFPNLKQISILDEVFHPPEEWMEEFVRRYKAEVGVFFSLMIHPGLLSEKWLESLEKTGERFGVNFGLQSGSDRVRREVFDRPTSQKNIEKVIALLNKHTPYLEKVVDVIVDNPFETPEEFRQSALTLFKMKRPIFLQVFSLMFYPGLPITNRAIEAGYIKRDELPGYKEDTVELWIPGLVDPAGSNLKTFIKVLIHLHQLKMRSLLRPSREVNPIPRWLLTLLAKKKNISERLANGAVKTHGVLMNLAMKSYLWGGRVQFAYELVRYWKWKEFFKRSGKLVMRGGKMENQEQSKPQA